TPTLTKSRRVHSCVLRKCWRFRQTSSMHCLETNRCHCSWRRLQLRRERTRARLKPSSHLLRRHWRRKKRLLLSKPLQRKMAVKCWQRLPRYRMLQHQMRCH
ncbi:unnamed protein product, partial [Symbiodinium pilosum]